MSAIEITQVKTGGTGSAVALLETFFHEEGFTTPRKRIEANLELMLQDASCWAALARVDGKPVGVVTVSTMVYVEWGRMGEIGDLYVQPDCRKLGVARALIDAALVWCQAKSCSAVSVVITQDGEQRHGLSKFYADLKFKPTGRTFMTKML
jgi:GNAT superfamily N-acetyltransferase